MEGGGCKISFDVIMSICSVGRKFITTIVKLGQTDGSRPTAGGISPPVIGLPSMESSVLRDEFHEANAVMRFYFSGAWTQPDNRE